MVGKAEPARDELEEPEELDHAGSFGIGEALENWHDNDINIFRPFKEKISRGKFPGQIDSLSLNEFFASILIVPFTRTA